MFCPNCGQDCGDAKFCTGCGTQLQQATAQKLQKNAWTVGTPCPYCGGVGLNGNCCAFCGVQLLENTQNASQPPICPGECDLDAYFYRYKPNRLKAIKALRADTGMDLVEAKEKIDETFDRHLNRSDESELSVAKRNLMDAIKGVRSKRKN